MMRDRDCSGGFSLVEVLVAIAVTGMVVIGASSLTSLTRNADGRSIQDATTRDEIIATHRIFREIVTNAMPSSGDEGAVAPLARGDRLTIRSTASAIMVLDRPAIITVGVRTGETGLKALVTVWNDPTTVREHEETLLDGARSISLSYFGSVAGEAAAWHPTWADFRRLPLAVALRVDIPSFGSPFDMIARTITKFPQSCAAFPIEPSCKAVISIE